MERREDPELRSSIRATLFELPDANLQRGLTACLASLNGTPSLEDALAHIEPDLVGGAKVRLGEELLTLRGFSKQQELDVIEISRRAQFVFDRIDNGDVAGTSEDAREFLRAMWQLMSTIAASSRQIMQNAEGRSNEA